MIIILKMKKGKGKKNGRTREGECISGVFFWGRVLVLHSDFEKILWDLFSIS